MCNTCDLRILICDTLCCINDQNRYITSFNSRYSTDDTVTLNIFFDLALSSKSCSINKHTTRALKNKEWQPLLAGNPHIKLYIYNTTPIEGFQVFCNWIFRKGWGVPRPHNVLIPSIAMGLRLPFKKIYLAGADHSWLPEITVTDDNVVLMHQKHFYDQNKSQAETVKQENLNSARLHIILYHMHVAFKSYFILEAYARRLGKEIINVTPGSYIDAFKRMKL